MFYLGGHFPQYAEIEYTRYNGIVRLSKTAGTYAYIIRNTLYDFVLNMWTPHYGIDEFYDYEVQPTAMCLAMVPFMVGHLDGFSDVAGHEVKYEGNNQFQKSPLAWIKS
jgi:hypothetical protein